MRLVWPRLATLVSWVFHVFGQLYYFDEIDKLLLGNDIVVNAECRKVDPCLFLGVTAFRTRECLPCAAYAAIPAHFAAGTICFQRTVPTVKSENLILSARPSTENAGGIFHPIHPIKKEVMDYDKTENRP